MRDVKKQEKKAWAQDFPAPMLPLIGGEK